LTPGSSVRQPTGKLMVIDADEFAGRYVSDG
jgi:hypothetical protein